MGQDGEEAAELIATIRGEHVEMKKWYSGPSPQAEAVRIKYGPYPGLWKEVLNWPGWKEARKAYLQFQQVGDKKPAAESSVPRKRRSRWGNSDEQQQGPSGDSSAKQQRRSRWGRDEPTPGPPRAMLPAAPPFPGAMPAIPGLPSALLPGMPTNLSVQQQEQMKELQSRLRTINHRLNNLEQEATRVDALPRGHRERSPSPPPVYGADGKRKNTRAMRWRERYSSERHEILEKIMGLDPNNRRSGLPKRKRSKKIPIPVEQHPTYNFIGLIIGPRGKTQKELEAKTGCKIAIRGKGSIKEGARGRRDGKVMEGDDEPLHVVITGDDQRSVDAAADMIHQMLVVIDDEKNVHKQNQLRELALLNGTLKEDEYCQVCGEKGHRAFECPKRFSMNKTKITVKCAICGDTSHPTRDCTQKPTEQKDEAQMDSDYMSFMAELDGKKVDKGGANSTGSSTLAKPPMACIPAPTGVTVIKSADGTTPAQPPPPSAGITIIKPAAAAASGVAQVSQPPPPLPGTGLPPPPSGLPPPPPNGGPGLPPPPMPPSTTGGVVAPPPVVGTPGQVVDGTAVGNPGAATGPPGPASTNLPPPPTSVPPPHPNGGGYAPPPQQQSGGYNNDYYGNQGGGHQGYNRYGHQGPPPQQQQHQQHYPYQQQQQPPPQQQQQQQQQQGQYDETAAWDYQSYYGNSNGGSGGLNWWDSGN